MTITMLNIVIFPSLLQLQDKYSPASTSYRLLSNWIIFPEEHQGQFKRYTYNLFYGTNNLFLFVGPSASGKTSTAELTSYLKEVQHKIFCLHVMNLTIVNDIDNLFNENFRGSIAEFVNNSRRNNGSVIIFDDFQRVATMNDSLIDIFFDNINFYSNEHTNVLFIFIVEWSSLGDISPRKKTSRFRTRKKKLWTLILLYMK